MIAASSGLPNAILFIESDYYQAQEIAKQSGKPVLCVASQHIITPSFSVATIKQLPLRLRTAHYRRLRYWVHRLVGDRGYQKLKSLVGGIKSLVRKLLKRGRVDSKAQVAKPETGASGN